MEGTGGVGGVEGGGTGVVMQNGKKLYKNKGWNIIKYGYGTKIKSRKKSGKNKNDQFTMSIFSNN